MTSGAAIVLGPATVNLSTNSLDCLAKYLRVGPIQQMGDDRFGSLPFRQSAGNCRAEKLQPPAWEAVRQDDLPQMLRPSGSTQLVHGWQSGAGTQVQSRE